MIIRPTIPCPKPTCRLRVLQDNDQWHVRPTGPETYQLVQAHDLLIEDADDIYEEIEEYD